MGENTLLTCNDEEEYYLSLSYSFNIEKEGYRSPNSPLVPSIMMTKRDTIEELMPCQAIIKIHHNDGSLISSYAL